jgi:hypothetical protein
MLRVTSRRLTRAHWFLIAVLHLPVIATTLWAQSAADGSMIPQEAVREFRVLRFVRGGDIWMSEPIKMKPAE